MKTIQEYLKNCNKKEIINMYISKYVFMSELMDRKYKNKTCGEIIEKYSKLLNEYIDKLVSMKPSTEDKETWILVSAHSFSEFDDEIQHLLIKKSDLLNQSDFDSIVSYAYDLSSFDEVIKFYVADTYLTQYYIDELLVEFLYESSFTGFNHENLEEILGDLKKTTKEIEEHKDDPNYFYSIEEVFKDLEENHDIEFEKKDEKQEEAYNKFVKQLMEFNKICRNIELKKLKDMIIELKQ